jgi:hypothetical protein
MSKHAGAYTCCGKEMTLSAWYCCQNESFGPAFSVQFTFNRFLCVYVFPEAALKKKSVANSWNLMRAREQIDMHWCGGRDPRFNLGVSFWFCLWHSWSLLLDPKTSRSSSSFTGLLMSRPSPMLSYLLVVEVSTWLKDWNICLTYLQGWLYSMSYCRVALTVYNLATSKSPE